jgi:hypothetical protein
MIKEKNMPKTHILGRDSCEDNLLLGNVEREIK